MSKTAAATVTLGTPIQRGDQEIDTVQLRQPTAGELRGLNLVDVVQLEAGALITLLPRITDPGLTDAEVAGLGVTDFMALAQETVGFLLPSDSRPA
ncbi:phage tail assembly protein [Halorhodospira neutriphila]|uniref:Tail E family protein n=1 Tax=Halorhodospira neutriphila TaxID=168379 RepID=A0ABS1E5R9_9GAMM|nr:phage tail assembly protein [Halorhodospira neutriphila]MBK1725726.1 hypothetical protein [Halorhodospira neutriphila]